MSNVARIEFKWNTDDLEIRTKSVEKTLEPLINHVTTLMQDSPLRVKKGQSKKAQVLIAAVQKATENFIQQGELIAREHLEVQKDMMKIIQDVRNSGEHLCQTSLQFSQMPCSSEARLEMVKAARALLRDVTRLLILADMVDVYLLLRSLQVINGDLDRLSSAQNNHELTSCMDDFNQNLNEVNSRSANRQMDLKDERRRDDLAAARAVLKKSSVMLFTTTKTHVRHPELQAARSNRDFVLGQVRDAVKDISNVAMETGSKRGQDPHRVTGDLANALNEFESQIIIDPISYSEDKTRPKLEAMLEKIIGRAAMLADGTSTRDERRDKIIKECQNLRSALQDLLSEYLYSSQNPGSTEYLDASRDQVYARTRCLRKHLNRSVGDHVSDCFLDTDMPLLLMMEAAGEGDEARMEAYAGVFVEHADKLVEVSNMACSMSTNESGIRMVRMACDQLQRLCPQVVNACRTLCSRPSSAEARENAEAFKEAWLRQLMLLTDAVDDVVSLEDFLAVSEQHVLEDINQCVLALQHHDPPTLDETSGRIRGRCGRVCDVTEGEMMSYRMGDSGGNQYVDRVMSCVVEMRKQIIIRFTDQMSATINALNLNAPVDENGFVQASNLVYEGVQNIRKAVLNNQNTGEYDSDAEDEAEFERFSKKAAVRKSRRQDNVVYEEDSDRARMRALPEEERNKIQQQVQLFRMEKAKLDREVERWDESSNDIIIIAKQMCMIMMEMTDFMRGQGHLKSTMDVINAAKKISEAGAELDKLCKGIADQCQDSVTKKDLMAYLQRIALHCHQLNITSKVKADVQNIGGELIVSGLESATSLIQAAKNLMNAVVLAVRASYVASTKYPKAGASLNISWRMKAPEKKPLVQRETLEDMRAKVRRGENKKTIEPIKALSEFQA